MAEKIVSPGVFTKEIDVSFLPAAIGEIGAAIIGPTVKGPAMIPTVVTSYADFQNQFGDTFTSGSGTFQYLTSVTAKNYLQHSGRLTVVRILDNGTGDSFSRATAFIPTGSGNNNTGSAPPYGSANEADTLAAASFKLNTIAHGAIMTNRDLTIARANNILVSGSDHNIRWEIQNTDDTKGTFDLYIRAGSDTSNTPNQIESHLGLSLDPKQSNYIGKRIGDQYADIDVSDPNDPFITYNGQYPNKSKHVYVSDIKDTIDYLDENGSVRVNAASASLPGKGSGSYEGTFTGGTNGYAGFDALGNISGSYNTAQYLFYENISSTNSQGYRMTSTTSADGGGAYIEALNLLKNGDEYDINLLLLPGVIDGLAAGHTGIISKAIDVCRTRGDCFLIYDCADYTETTISNVTSTAATRDTNYGATYWPWVKVPDSQTGGTRWVPPSVVLPGIYAFNDKIAAPWFAPAGLNRGGLDTVIQAARNLTHANRDDLYDSNVNPIATFPGQGVVVWGQKTLQKKSSALDRVNVRRLLIKVKKFISASSRFLVFEQNNTATRERFLNIANPYLEQVQAQSGLSAFKVVMDETNNTPDIVDRNILYGQIFLQPTRTAEFIVLDFTIQATGASFPG